MCSRWKWALCRVLLAKKESALCRSVHIHAVSLYVVSIVVVVVVNDDPPLATAAAVSLLRVELHIR